MSNDINLPPLPQATLEDHDYEVWGQNDDTYRGGAIWTICRDCGQRWADDRGGFVPYIEPKTITDLRAAIAQPVERTSLEQFDLLEAAAKAAGLKVRLVLVDGSLDVGADVPPWNPLTDDGDALRLAARCGLGFVVYTNPSEVWCSQERGCGVQEPFDADPLPAIRRAIVRAAAAIGEGKA